MLKIGLLYNGKTPTEIYYGGNKLHEIWYNGAKVLGKLGVPAKITYDATYTESSSDMLGGFPNIFPRQAYSIGGSNVILVCSDIYILDTSKSSAPVTATRRVWDSNGDMVVGSLMIGDLLYVSVEGPSGGLFVLDKALNIQTALKGYSIGNIATDGNTIFAECYLGDSPTDGVLKAFKLPITPTSVPINDSANFDLTAYYPTVGYSNGKILVGNGAIEEYSWNGSTLTHVSTHSTGIASNYPPDTGTIFNSDGSIYVGQNVTNTITKFDSNFKSVWTYTLPSNLYTLTSDDSGTIYAGGNSTAAFSVINPSGVKIYDGINDVQYLGSNHVMNVCVVSELEEVFIFYGSSPTTLKKFKITR